MFNASFCIFINMNKKLSDVLEGIQAAVDNL